MKLRYLVAIAVGVYGTVVGCVLFAPGQGGRAASRAPHSFGGVPAGLPYRGIVLQLQSLYQLDGYEKTVDEIADTGADTIFLVLSARMENGSSSEVFMDTRVTPTPDKLAELVVYCKKKHLRVAMMPVVLLDHAQGEEWRGKLKPRSWADWFDSYREMIDSFAAVAGASGVDLFVVGSELVTTEEHADEWTRTIASVRERYHGTITYSANWDHYYDIPFWDQLDLIGVNCYYKLGDNADVTVDQIVQNWQGTHKTLTDFAAKKGKPLIFLEVGWCSVTNAASDPWDYTQTGLQTDKALQERLYEGFFRTWYGDPNLAGFMVWEWPPGPPADKGYTPEGKPAEKVLRDYLAKPPWTVR